MNREFVDVSASDLNADWILSPEEREEEKRVIREALIRHQHNIPWDKPLPVNMVYDGEKYIVTGEVTS